MGFKKFSLSTCVSPYTKDWILERLAQDRGKAVQVDIRLTLG